MPRPPRHFTASSRSPGGRHAAAFRAWGVAAIVSGLLGAAAPIARAQQEAAPAKAQDQEPKPVDLTELSLEQLMEIPIDTVYGASMQLQTTVEAPSSVTIITAREIEAQGWRTLADVLRSVRSFYVTDDRNYEHLGVRGFSPVGDFNSRVLLLVDGHRINNSVYGTAAIGLEFPLDVDLIQRVEIIRGPGSSLYGSNAVFGVINVITRSGAQIGGLELSAEGGSFETYRGRTTWGGELGPGIDVVASATAFQSEGDGHFYPEFSGTPSGGHTRGTDDEHGYSLFTRATWKSWRLEGAWVSREKGIPTGSYGTVFDDDDNQTVDQQGYVDLSGDQRLADDWTLHGQLYVDQFYYRGTYIYDMTASGGPPDQKSIDRGNGASAGSELTVSTTSFADHRITAGAEVRCELRQDQSYRDPTAVYLDDERDGTIVGTFVQDEMRLAERLTLNAGLRYDHYNTFGGTVNPRAGLIWNPDMESTWKVLYGKAFRAPNAYELYYGDGGSTQKANPDLDPETIRTYELVHEHRFDSHWRGSASLFHYDIDDLIVETVDPADGLLVFGNTSEVHANGVEVEGERRLEDGFRLVASYSWQRVIDESTHDVLPNSPEHMVKLLGEAPVFCDWLFAGVDYQWMSARDTLAGNDVASYGVLNLTLRTREFDHGLRAFFTVRNLFDEKYSDPGGVEHLQDQIEQDGRTYLVRVTCRF